MKRKILDQFLTWKTKKNRKPLVLFGVRQAGKTHALKNFGQTHFEQTHYFNFEQDKKLADFFSTDLLPHRIIQDLSLYADKPIRPGQDLVIFDEIQECPAALTSLKYFAEDFQGLSLCAAGSHIGLSLSSASFPVGKVDLLRLFPMSFSEFLLALGDELSLDVLNGLGTGRKIPEGIHERIFRQFKKYLIVGGLPEVVNLFCKQQEDLFETFRQVREQQQILIAAYLRDVAKHAGKVNAMHIERVLQNIPSQLARSLDGSAKKYVFKEVVPGKSRYAQLAGPIDWLTTAGLVLKTNFISRAAQPLKAHAIENAFKLYLFDVGLLGALGNLAPRNIWEYNFGSYKGYLAENFVAQEFMTNGIPDYYAWNENMAEIEFVIDREGQIVPIEVKSGQATRSRSLGAFIQKYHPQQAFVLSLNMKKEHRSPIRGMPLYGAGWMGGMCVG